MEKASYKSVYLSALFFFLLFIAGRLAGPTLFDNNWSFLHWQYIPFWNPILALVVAGILWFFFSFKPEIIDNYFSNKFNVMTAFVLLAVYMGIFHVDSFVYRRRESTSGQNRPDGNYPSPLVRIWNNAGRGGFLSCPFAPADRKQHRRSLGAGAF